jgi:predicted RNA methylase
LKITRRKVGPSGHLFIEPSGQRRLIDKSVEQQRLEAAQAECLGMIFANDDARRDYFLAKLAEKLKDPEFRKIEGFPVGDDEDILALSDPPYYTACPNPFLADFVTHFGKPYKPDTRYHRTPFAVDVSEGKTDPLYTAHSYHTKVPPKAIVRAIVHYTEPSDLILDGFAGSGMTGVAANLCGHPDPELKQQVEAERKKEKLKAPVWGTRRVVMGEISPAATFIAANYNLPFDVERFKVAAQRILDEVEDELGWMYETLHSDGKTIGRINYTVWSEVFSCPECTGEVVFLEEALDAKTKRVREEFPCPHCKARLTKDNLERRFETLTDPATKTTWRRIALRPVLINYSVGGEKHEKAPDKRDLSRLAEIAELRLPPEVPTNRFPVERMYHGSRIAPKGFTHVHHFFLPRPAQALAALWRKATAYPDIRLRHMLLFFVEQAIWGMSVLARYAPTHFSQVNRQLTGVYYVASQIAEVSPWYNLSGKLKRLTATFEGRRFDSKGETCTTTGSTAAIGLPDDSIDYVFTDPPFGENIYYADLNFLVESWHRVRTEPTFEAIVDQAKHKDLQGYQELMRRCLSEFYRVLKPGRWLTMVFHNSSNAVWNAIQEALLAAGFMVADVRTLDKQQGSYRQVTSTAVKQDLIISAYKPNGGLEQRFKLHAGTPEGAWDFVRQHLSQAVPFKETDGRSDTIGERTDFVLFDRMVAFHVQRGATVPLNLAEFRAGLKARFPERDGMFFLPEQVAEYDRRRLEVGGLQQLSLFVNDERTARQWLQLQLRDEPQTYSEIMPKFLRELHKANHEQLPELRDLLEQNFLKDDQDRWYVPDPNEQADLEKLRERQLLQEFEAYKDAKPKQLKVFRTEAIRAGFKAAWAARDYRTIVGIAEKLPEDLVREESALLMYYDNARMRLE